MRPSYNTLILALLHTALGVPSLSAAQQSDANLGQASLETLTQTTVQVSTFARRNSTLWNTPGAVYVISRDDIERNSFTSIPELLRLVPGLQVAQINASTWAVSARGFNSIFADKLLVLVDGRTVYSEIFSGVPWDQMDLPLSNIERIEVIRGPGAAVWGADAANGVINIITRRARNTQGETAKAEAGRIIEKGFARYGGTLGDRAQYNAYASAINREPFEAGNGQRAYDGEGVLRTGGRLDWQKDWADLVLASGDLYGGHVKQTARTGLGIPVGPNNEDRGSIAGGYLLSRWEHAGKTHDAAFQAYFDDESRKELGNYARTRALDFDVQDHIRPGSWNDLVWGFEVRYTSDHTAARDVLLTGTDLYRNCLFDGFMQDDVALVPNRLNLMLGSKLQQGTLAGFQAQPSARIIWTPHSPFVAWGAISRAAVTPSVQDLDVIVPFNLGVSNGIPITAELLGNPAFKPEIVNALEAGLRRKVGPRITADIAGFLNKTERVQSLSFGSPVFMPIPNPHVSTDLLIGNGFRARSGGVESTLSWTPAHSLSFVTSYTWANAHTQQSTPGQLAILDAWNTPRHTLAYSANWSFAPGWSTNAFLSYTSDVPGAANTSDADVKAYTRVDLKVTRLLGDQVRISAGGTNLLTPRHAEFGDSTGFDAPLFVPRSVSVKAGWSF